jgi:hypothetical protein
MLYCSVPPQTIERGFGVASISPVSSSGALVELLVGIAITDLSRDSEWL